MFPWLLYVLVHLAKTGHFAMDAGRPTVDQTTVGSAVAYEKTPARGRNRRLEREIDPALRRNSSATKVMTCRRFEFKPGGVRLILCSPVAMGTASDCVGG